MLKATCVKEPKQRNKNKRVYLYLAQPTELIEEFFFWQYLKNMKNFFLVLLIVSAFLSALFDLSESWSRRRRIRSCNRQDCTHYWTSYGSCSRTCGGGKQNQRLVILRYPTCGGTACPAQRYRTISCNTHCCPLDCAWSWNSWGPCRGCGISKQTRTMRITRYPSCGGTMCPFIRNQTQNCNTGV